MDFERMFDIKCKFIVFDKVLKSLEIAPLLVNAVVAVVSRFEIPPVELPLRDGFGKRSPNFVKSLLRWNIFSGHNPDALHVGNIEIKARVNDDEVIIVCTCDVEIWRMLIIDGIDLSPREHVDSAIAIASVLAVKLSVFCPLEIEGPKSIRRRNSVNIVIEVGFEISFGCTLPEPFRRNSPSHVSLIPDTFESAPVEILNNWGIIATSESKRAKFGISLCHQDRKCSAL